VNQDTSFLEDVMSAGFFVVDDAADGAARSLEEIEAKLDEMGQSSPKVIASLIAIAQAGGPMAKQLADAGITVGVLEQALQNAAVKSKEFADIQQNIDTILAESGNTVERNVDAWDDYSDVLKGIADKANEAKEAIEDASDAAGTAFESTGDVELERLKVFQAIADAAEAANEPLAEGESMQERFISNLENERDIRSQILDAAEAAAGALEGVAATDAQITFLQDLRDEIALLDPELAALVDGLIANLESGKVQFDISTEEGQAQFDAFIAANTDKSVVADMLIDSGMGEAQVNNFLQQMSDEEVLEITTRAITKLAEEDIGALNDPDRVTEVVVDALTDEADEKLKALQEEGLYDVEPEVRADLTEFTREVARARLAAGKEIVIPVRTSAGTRPTTPTTTPQPDGLLLFDEFGRQLTTDDGQAYGTPTRYRQTVAAGQPIVNNNTYITVPTADPSATVRAIQRWSRWNGAIPVSRGR
jgi:hypothetical protein